MNNYIDDPVFGHMEYRHRWFKTDEYEMFGKKWTLTVAAKAYSGKPITDAERASYQKFQENQQETLALLSQKVKYSLQGTTQGNGLTGGVPPVRFSM